LTSSLSVEVVPVTELRFPVEGGYREVVAGCNVSGPAENMQAALAKVEGASIGPTKDQAEEWLAILQVATAGGRKTEANHRLALGVYSGALTRYPADVAKEACYRLATSSKWFPTLADVIEQCDLLSAPRMLMLQGLRRRCGLPA